MAVVRKKQDDKHLKTLREIVSLGGNKACFDCGQRGPTYVNMTIGSFVCTRCSGLLRGITPPHRVKSISMATFTADEIEFIRAHGNDTCSKTWLGLWDPKRALTQDQRDLMVDKYERKRYFLEPASPLKSLPQHTNNTTNNGNLLNGLQSNGTAHLHNVTPIALTPPATLRLGAASSRNNNNATAATAKTNNGTAPTTTTTHQFHTQFTPDDQPAGGIFGKPSSSNNSNIITNNNNSPSFNGKPLAVGNKTTMPTTNGSTRHGMSGLSGSQATNGERSSSRLSGPPTANTNNNNNINNNGNQFTPDGDFGTDFLFGPGKTTAATTSQRVLGQPQTNGNGVDGGDANADFADFEHNAIFNAAESQYTSAPFVYNGNNAMQNGGSTINNNPMHSHATNQWNVWQQYQLPFIPPPEQNRWSLPMSLSSTSAGSLNSSGSTPFNSSSSSINSTPPVDRYAALKDLDMQLREVVKDTGLFSSGNGTVVTSTATNNGIAASSTAQSTHHTDANPFKPPPAQQLQNGAHHNGAALIPNPFQASGQLPMNSNGAVGQPTGWATDFGSAVFANGAVQHQQQQQQQQQQHHHQQASMFGGSNGNVAFGHGFHHHHQGTTVMQQTNGFGMMQRNPFAATTTGALPRSNNPFL